MPVLDVPPASEFASALGVADAVLFEGYLLYPYRRSSAKNRVRWQFGVLAPRRWVQAQGPDVASVAGSADAWRQRTDCLFEAPPAATMRVRIRFLQLRHRGVQAIGVDGGYREVDTLDVDGERHLTFDEAVPHEIDLVVQLAGAADPTELADPTEVADLARVVAATAGPGDAGGRPQVRLRPGTRTVMVEIPGAEEVEPLGGGAGAAGRIVRRRWPVSATVRLSVTPAPAPFRLYRLRLVTENTVADLAPDEPRPSALRRSLVAVHSLVAVSDGGFLSLLDPPGWATVAAKDCVNLHTFPVLAGADGAADVVLSSPIILYDHPEVSPESPGDLFDATEIDEILSLRTLTLTDDEKREARATDPRAAEIIDRVDGIPRDMLARLHGAVRSLRPVASAQPSPAENPGLADRADRTVPWWEPEADRSVRPDTDTVLVDGVAVAKGSRVRLHPRARGSDVHDMFLEGRAARVEAVFLDVDDARHVAVLLEDDPATELHQWYGRYYYFTPDELAPLDRPPDAP